jgi:CRP/FNR family transcriptional regulator, cyclic AMP receptor protein
MFGRNNRLDVDWLANVSFFEGLDRSELERVAALAERVEAEPGAELTDQGRYGDVCYVIVSGSANVYMNGEYITALGSGTMVGEMALLEHRPRVATVVAETPMVLAAFGTKEFRTLLDELPKAKERVLSVLGDRLRANMERRSH